MSDPRERLDRTTITGVTSKNQASIGFMYPRTSPKHPDETLKVKDPRGFYRTTDQNPKAEGEVFIHQHSDYGLRQADIYVAINIDGSLEWRKASFYNYTVTDGVRD